MSVIDTMKVANAISSKIEPEVKKLTETINNYYASIKEQPLTEDILVAGLEILASYNFQDKHPHEVKRVLYPVLEQMPPNKRLYALFYLIQAIVLNSIQKDIEDKKL